MNTTRRVMLAATAAQLALLAGCATPAPAPAPAPAPTPAPLTPGERLASLLDGISTDILRLSPERCTSLGVTEARAGGRFIDKLSDNSKAGSAQQKALTERSLAALAQINRAELNHADAITYDVVTASFQNSLASAQFDMGGGATAPYAITQLTGAYVGTPDFLDSRHPMQTRDHVDAYLARVQAFARQVNQDTEVFNVDVGAGVIPPDFTIDRALSQLNAFARPAPANNLLVQSIQRRLPSVSEIPEGQRAALVARCEQIVRDEVLPAYQRQIAALGAVRPRATHAAGVIPRLRNGEALYAAALKSRTTTTMAPAEIHQMGVDIVRQSQSEMDQILRAQHMTRGSVAQRVRALSRRADQLYPNTDAGRAQILADLNARTRDITARCPRAFGTLAHAPLEIRRVPPTTEAGAPGGYYQRGSIDGTRPGAYYINLRDTHEWPKFTLPTLNYHEGIPGHHWQGSISQESGGLPFIRGALLGNSAYSEGWGLYAEQLASELGVYDDDPLGRLGYLQSMAFRASRLVVDTGMHTMGWSREQAIQSMSEATGDQISSITTEIERYCVWPGQACSYMVGKVSILRLRESAHQTLGDRFDIKGYHDAVLTNGGVPLSVLERIVADWVATRRA